jgi:hypothetical protein
MAATSYMKQLVSGREAYESEKQRLITDPNAVMAGQQQINVDLCNPLSLDDDVS